MLIEVKKLTRHMKASVVKCDAASLTSLHMLKFTIEMDLRDSLPTQKRGLKLFLIIFLSVASSERKFYQNLV